MSLWVVSTEQDAVFEAGFAVVYPVFDVMTLARAWWSSAAGEGAALVPYDEGSADGSVDGASFASDVKHLAGSAEDDGEDFGVAGPLPHGLRAELGAVVQYAGAVLGADPVAELAVVDGHHDLGPVAAVLGEFAALVDELAHADEGVGAALSWGAGVGCVLGGAWGAEWVDGGA